MMATNERSRMHISPHEGLTKAPALNAFGVLSEVAAVSGIGRFTHCAAIRVRLPMQSCAHRRSPPTARR